MADVPEKRTEPDGPDEDPKGAPADDGSAGTPESEAGDVLDTAAPAISGDVEVTQADDEEQAESGPEDGDTLDTAADVVSDDIEQLIAARDDYLNHLRRVQAEFENYKKQVQKRLDANVASQLGGFVERLLPVLDACDAAAQQEAGDAVEPILTALYGALEKEGLERIDPKGEAFDPAVAEAVQHLPGEGGEQVVAEVMRTGYRWKGRLLRPALVRVTD